MIPLSYFMNGEYISIDTINHIADLEQEIERLNTNLEVANEDLTRIAQLLNLEEGCTIYDIEDKIERLNNIINKAIEYMENMPYLQEVDEEFENVDGEVYFTYKEWDDTELLDILKGVDKE